MISVPLHISTKDEEILEMKEWLAEINGYIGDSDFFFDASDVITMRFYKIAYLVSEEDAIAFRLRFCL